METAASDSATRREDERDFLRLQRGPELCSECVVICLRRADGEPSSGTASGEGTVSLTSSAALSTGLTVTSELNRRTLAKGLAISAVGERVLGVANRD